MNKHLINKYNVPGPRYTSYPTVPFWTGSETIIEPYKASVKRSFEATNQTEGISLYIHLPFCESLCTFCGCNKRITKNHAVEDVYIDALLKEWGLYSALFSEKPIIKELHLGGGTPTFFHPQSLKKMLDGIFEHSIIPDNPLYSFEGHPNSTTLEHLQVFKEYGFDRVSYGVQDYDAKVQEMINRKQTFEQVKTVTELSREAGYSSVGHDLIFGLPFQTLESIEQTIEYTKKLKPERIAFYSYAHVPWIKGVGQRKFSEADLPSAKLKRALYETGREKLEALGYVEVGMDHFALPQDELHQSMVNKKLHRNFMGYTSSKTQLMIGLGVSSIGDSWYAFGQNEKKLEDYYQAIEEGRLPIFRGHDLSEEDLSIRQHILNLMCAFETSLDENDPLVAEILSRLAPLVVDELMEIEGNKIIVLEKGKPFVRNICMAFDTKLWGMKPETKLFSMTV